MSQTNRCTGHCCRSFTLAISPEHLAEEFHKDASDPSRMSDVDIVYPMVIYLGRFPTNPLLKTVGESWSRKALRVAEFKEREPDIEQVNPRLLSFDAKHWYTCRHLKLTGDCGIYENRPGLCRRYPNREYCAFQDCTMPKKVQDKHIKKIIKGDEERARRHLKVVQGPTADATKTR